MRTFVESLKRLYSTGRVEFAKVNELFTEGKITQEEYEYITQR